MTARAMSDAELLRMQEADGRLRRYPQGERAAAFGDEAHVLVPVGLLGAACSAIDKKRDAPKTLAELRRYTTGDLSRHAPAPAAGDAWEIDLDRVLSIADEHAEESREDGRRVLDRGGLLALARDVLRVAEAPTAAGDALVLPDLNAELIDILGRPNFTCIRIAQLLRLGGVEIATKAEAEQATVIHYLLGFYLKHGSQWAEKANEDLNRRRDAAIAQQKGEA